MTNAALDPETQQRVREMALAAEISFANNYRVFVDDQRGRTIMENFAKTLNGRPMSPGITHGEVMFYEGQRAVYLGILAQIEKAGVTPPAAVDGMAGVHNPHQ